MFSNADGSHVNPPNSGYFDFKYSNSELSIYAFPLPDSKASKKNKNARKRKAESVPIENSNTFQQKKTRQSADLRPNFGTFNPPKINRKQKLSAIRLKSPSQEQLYNKIIESAKLNKIFNSILPKDENVDEKSDLKVPDVSHLIKDCPLAKLDSNPFVTKIDNEIKRIVESATLPESAFKAILNNIIQDLNTSFQIEGCTNKWNCFGSYLYGLVSEDSDIDLYYECMNNGTTHVTSELPMKMRRCLQKSKKFYRITFIKNARVPVLKAIHCETRKQVDISFSSDLGVRNSLLTKLYLSLNPNLKYLTLYLKHILRKYYLSGTHKITSHILFWLVCFFMQQKKLLPAVSDVRRSAEINEEVAGWDCSLPVTYPFQSESVSVYSLLLEFFAFYKDFDFLNYVICPFLGRVFLLSDFERAQISADELAVYYKRVPNTDQCTFSRCAMNLQDPTDLSFNLAKQVLVWNTNKFKILCHSFSHLLPNTVSELDKIDSLSQILPYKMDFDNYTPYNLTQYAMFMLQNKSLGSCSSKLNHYHVLETVRKVMECIFGLDKTNIVIAENLTQASFSEGKVIKKQASILYFEYCSSENTWKNEIIKEIIPRNEGEKEQIRVYLTCEVCLQRNFIRLIVQGEVNLIRFLRENATKLFSFGLSEVLSA